MIDLHRVAILEKIKKLYDINLVGGYAHLVVDDYNVDDESIEYCISYINEIVGNQIPDTEQKICLEILNDLKAYNEDQRFEILNDLKAYNEDQRFDILTGAL